MLKKGITFLLGAGASVEVRMPVGTGLAGDTASSLDRAALVFPIQINQMSGGSPSLL